MVWDGNYKRHSVNLEFLITCGSCKNRLPPPMLYERGFTREHETFSGESLDGF